MVNLQAPKRVGILSYNIRHGKGLDGQIDLARIAGVIRSASPDIVALQEVDRRMSRTGYMDQAGELAHLTGMQVAFGRAMRFKEQGQYGNAILSRWPITRAETRPLPGKLEPRSVLIANMTISTDKDNPVAILFLATHLALDEASRLRSVTEIASIVDTWPGPALLAGDLNAKPTSAVIDALGQTWNNTTTGQELITFGPNPAQIDYIFYRPENRWHVVETRVIDERVASDHCPILAILDLSS